MGSIQGSLGHLLPLLWGAAHPLLTSVPTVGFTLRGTTPDFLAGTWTRKGPTVLLEKTEHSASGSPEEAANMSLGINCVLGLEL